MFYCIHSEEGQGKGGGVSITTSIRAKLYNLFIYSCMGLFVFAGALARYTFNMHDNDSMKNGMHTHTTLCTSTMGMSWCDDWKMFGGCAVCVATGQHEKKCRLNFCCSS